MRPRARRQRHSSLFEIRGPGVHVISRPHDQTQMVQRLTPPRVIGRRPVQGQIVGARREVGVVWIRLPLDMKPKKLHVKTPRLVERADEQREVTKAQMRGRSVEHAQW